MRSARFNLLIDLNGTCHIGDTPTLGAVQAIQRLRAVQQQQPDRVNIRFCSNTSKESSSSLLSRLRRVGLGAELVGSSGVFTSLDAAYRLVARQKLRPLLLLSQSAQTAFRGDDTLARDCFFAHADLDPERLDAQNAAKLRSCDAVVVGLCPELMTSKWLDEAFRLLAGEYDAKQSVALITTHRGTFKSMSGACNNPAIPSLTRSSPYDLCFRHRLKSTLSSPDPGWTALARAWRFRGGARSCVRSPSQRDDCVWQAAASVSARVRCGHDRCRRVYERLYKHYRAYPCTRSISVQRRKLTRTLGAICLAWRSESTRWATIS